MYAYTYAYQYLWYVLSDTCYASSIYIYIYIYIYLCVVYDVYIYMYRESIYGKFNNICSYAVAYGAAGAARTDFCVLAGCVSETRSIWAPEPG